MKIDLLKNHPQYVEILAKWGFDTWGNYNPKATLEKAVSRFEEHLNDDRLNLTVIAFKNAKPIGMCSLRVNDGIRPDLTPWLGSLFVFPEHRGHGIGELLVQSICVKAKQLGYSNIYLLAFDDNIPSWYGRLGWQIIGKDTLYEHDVTVMTKRIENE